MAAAFTTVAVEQQGAETNINSYVCGYLQAIAVLHVVGNIVRKVAAIKQVEKHPEILVRR